MNSSTPSEGQAQVSPERPWLGLRSFTEGLRRYFFGRKQETAELLGRILDRHFTILYGQSGLGKTSLLQAGIAPGLRQNGITPVPLRLRFGEDDPPLGEQINQAVADALKPFFPERDLFGLFQAEGLWAAFHDPEAGLCGSGAPKLALILDQFEEIFTLGWEKSGRRPDSRKFIAALACLVENRPPPFLRERLEEDEAIAERLDFGARPLRVVLCLREDYLHLLERHRREMPSMMESRFELRPLAGPQAYLAAYEPGALRTKDEENPQAEPILSKETARGVVRFVAGIEDDSIPLEDIENVPPLLSLICEQLNEFRIREHADQIQADSLKKSAPDILRDFYERSFQPHPPAVRDLVEERLISGSGFRETITVDLANSQLRAAGVADPVKHLVALVNQRILVMEERGGAQRIELTHDILARLARESRLETALPVEEAAKRWEAQGKRRDYFLTGGNLAEARQLLEHRADSLSERAREFVRASVAGDEDSRRRRRSQGRLIIMTLTSMLAFAVFAALVAYQEMRKSEELRQDAEDAEFLAKIRGEEASRALELARRTEADAWLERARRLADSNQPDYFSAAMMSARASGFAGFGREAADEAFRRKFEPLLEPEAEDFNEISLYAGQAALPVWRFTPAIHHQGSLDNFAVSPDGTRLASSEVEKVVHLWNLRTGELVAKLDQLSGDIWDVEFSRDGSTLVTVSSEIELWEAATGAKIPRKLAGSHEAVRDVEFSPDGTRLAGGGDDPTILLWDFETGAQAGSLEIEDRNSIVSIKFSPDGMELGAGCAESIFAFDIATGERREFGKRGGFALDIEYHSDGELVAARQSGAIEIWNSRTGELTAELANEESLVYDLAFSPDRQLLASGSLENGIKIWDFAARKEALEIEGSTVSAFQIAFTPDGKRLVSDGGKQALEFWEVETGKSIPIRMAAESSSVAFSPDSRTFATTNGSDAEIRNAATGEVVATLAGHSGEVIQVAFHPKGALLASSSRDRMIRIWNLGTGECVHVLQTGVGDVTALKFSPDGGALAFGAGVDLEIWSLQAERLIGALPENSGQILSIDYSPDGSKLAVGMKNSLVAIWDRDAGPEKPIEFRGHSDPVMEVEFSPDGSILASCGSDGDVRLWPVAGTGSGAEKLVLSRRHSPVNAIAFHPGGSCLASASSDGEVRLWDLAENRPARVLRGHGDPVGNLAFSSDGSSLLSCSRSGQICLWDTTPGLLRSLSEVVPDSGSALASLIGPKHTLKPAFALSPDGLILASANAGRIRLWDTTSGGLIKEIEGNHGWIESLAFSPGGLLASGSDDRTVQIRDLAAGEPVSVLSGHEKRVVALAFSSDERYLASLDQGGFIKVWDVETGSAAAEKQVENALEILAFKPGEPVLAFAQAADASLWNVESDETVLAPSGGADLRSFAFSADGKQIATGSEDGAVWILEFESRKLRQTRAHAGPVLSLSFDPRGSLLASGGEDGSIRFHGIGPLPRRLIAEYRETFAEVSGLMFSPAGNGEAIVSVGPEGAHVWRRPRQRALDLAIYLRSGFEFRDDKLLPEEFPAFRLFPSANPPVNVRSDASLTFHENRDDPATRLRLLLRAGAWPNAIAEFRSSRDALPEELRKRFLQALIVTARADWRRPGATRVELTMAALEAILDSELIARGDLNLAIEGLVAAAAEIAPERRDRFLPIVRKLAEAAGVDDLR